MTTPKEYLKVGELKVVDGTTYVKPDFYDDGLVSGCIFKDEEAYEKDWGKPCYIAESEFMDCECDENGFYKLSDLYATTHIHLLDCCWQNRELCDYMFSKLLWANEDTYFNEMDDVDFAYFYRFIQVGGKVLWWDNEALRQVEAEIYKSPYEWDEHGEPIDPEGFSLDQVICIANDHMEGEVTALQLTPVYEDIKEAYD